MVTSSAFYLANPILGSLPPSPELNIKVDSTLLKKDIISNYNTWIAYAYVTHRSNILFIKMSVLYFIKKY